jgi:hypothetical protein
MGNNLGGLGPNRAYAKPIGPKRPIGNPAFRLKQQVVPQAEAPKKLTEADFPASHYTYRHSPTPEETAHFRSTGQVPKGMAQLAGYPEDLAMKVKHGLITVGQAKMRLGKHPHISYSDLREGKFALLHQMEDWSSNHSQIRLKSSRGMYNKDGSVDQRRSSFRNS